MSLLRAKTHYNSPNYILDINYIQLEASPIVQLFTRANNLTWLDFGQYYINGQAVQFVHFECQYILEGVFKNIKIIKNLISFIFLLFLNN